MYDRIIKHFDALVSAYDSYASLAKISAISELLNNSIDIGTKNKVLDVATGTGNFGHLFVKAGSNVTGLDINIKMLHEANNKGICTVLGTATKLPFRNKVFNVVLSRQLFQYLSRQKITESLDEMRRVLMCGGKLILHHITAPTLFTLKRVRLFMAVKDTPTVFLSCNELAEFVMSSGLTVDHKEIQSFRVEESTKNFCKVRNIESIELPERLNHISNINEFDLVYEDTISYNRHYSLIIASNKGEVYIK